MFFYKMNALNVSYAFFFGTVDCKGMPTGGSDAACMFFLWLLVGRSKGNKFMIELWEFEKWLGNRTMTIIMKYNGLALCICMKNLAIAGQLQRRVYLSGSKVTPSTHSLNETRKLCCSFILNRQPACN